MSYGLGIDVGTIFTRAAAGSHGQARIVAVSEDAPTESPTHLPQPDGDLLIRSTVRAGNVLVRGSGDGGTRLAPPIPLVLGGQAHRGIPLLARSLRAVIDTAIAAQGADPERVVLTCPAVWGPVRRRQLVDASRQVGLETVTVVSEPEAAAAFFVGAQRLAESDVVVVYDLGAARADLTVVRVTGSGTEILGQPEALEGVGGVDVDDVVMAHVDRTLGGALTALDPSDPADQARLDAARAACTRAKEALSENESAVVVLDLAAGTFRVSMNRTLFEPMIRAGLKATLTGLHRSMASAGVSSADLAAVVLVGGSSRIPLVGRLLAAELRRPVLTHENPQYCVALGAAAIADRAPARAETVDSPPPPPVPPTPVPSPPSGPGLWSRRRLVAVFVALSLLAGWTTYVALVPLIENPDSDLSFASGRTTAPPVKKVENAAPATTTTAASTAVPPTQEPTRSVSTTPALTATSIRASTASRTAVSRPEWGTGRLVGAGGHCLDAGSGSPTNRAGVQVAVCDSLAAQLASVSLAQIWTATPSGALLSNGKCLEASGTQLGARLAVSRCDGGKTQQWQVLSGRIENTARHACLEIDEKANGRTQLVTSKCGNSAAQHWDLQI
jgi:actin-like ATPase involved in cell morphogenesis